jgi:ABC-type uncharacterized transport system fused permease/ATPase subunit
MDGHRAATFKNLAFTSTALVVSLLLLALALWQGAVAALFWQRSLVQQLEAIYFNNKTLYAANRMVSTLDNMDQRITDDTRNFTQGMAAFVFGSFSGGFSALEVCSCVICLHREVRYGTQAVHICRPGP